MKTEHARATGASQAAAFASLTKGRAAHRHEDSLDSADSGNSSSGSKS